MAPGLSQVAAGIAAISLAPALACPLGVAGHLPLVILGIAEGGGVDRDQEEAGEQRVPVWGTAHRPRGGRLPVRLGADSRDASNVRWTQSGRRAFLVQEKVIDGCWPLPAVGSRGEVSPNALLALDCHSRA
jgi:hypothetical protein